VENYGNCKILKLLSIVRIVQLLLVMIKFARFYENLNGIEKVVGGWVWK
jgi:hypothetical protein